MPGAVISEAIAQATADENVHGPSLLDYARSFGLTVKYNLQSPFMNVQEEESDIDDASCDEQAPFLSSFKDISASLKERLAISTHVVQLLQTIHQLPGAYQPETFERDRVIKFTDLTQEIPLLQSDNEYELQHFANCSTPNLRTNKLPWIPCTENCDEDDTGWLAQDHGSPANVLAQVGNEKLEIERAVAEFIYGTITGCSRLSKIGDEAYGLQYPGLRRPRSLTPPLLPLSPPATPIVIFPAAGSAPHCQSLSVPSIVEAELFGQHLMIQDDLGPTCSSKSPEINSDEYHTPTVPSPLRSVFETPRHSPLRKHSLHDLKVEGPITPRLSSKYPNKRFKGAAFPETFERHRFGLLLDTESNEATQTNDKALADFTDGVTPLAAEADKLLNSEKLIEADSVRRVQVPTISAKTIIPPWLEYSQKPIDLRCGEFASIEPQRALLCHVKELDMGNAQQWHGNNKRERQMSWTPFPLELASVDLRENINTEGSANQVMLNIDLSETLQSATTCWKREGSRILDDTWASDEDSDLNTLEPAAVQLDDTVQTQSSSSIPGERCEERHETSPEAQHLVDREVGITSSDREIFRGAPTHNEHLVPESGLLFDGNFLDSLAVMDLLQGRCQPLDQSTTPSQAQSLPTITLEQQPESAVSGTLAADHFKWPSPDLSPDLPRKAIIISSSLLTSHKTVVGYIKELYPKLDLIEREWNISRRQPVARYDKRQPMPDEGDIIVSAGTTILLTTMAKIKQRGLPGHESSYYGVRERIAALARRFERLVILVVTGGAGSNAVKVPLDHHDAQAIAEVVGFSNAQEISVHFFLAFGEQFELARWLVYVISCYRDTDPDIQTTKLIHDQTLWETFLRYAGLNTFAAQAVLYELKDPSESVRIRSSSSSLNDKASFVYGLNAFLRMTPGERLGRLAPLLGGQKLLKEINQNMMHGW